MPDTARRELAAPGAHAELRADFRRTVDRVVGERHAALLWDSRQRWNPLIELARTDLCLARLVEAHLDAMTINAQLGGPAVQPGQYWAVWAAEPPDGRVSAEPDEHARWRLTGTKRWCSGADLCSHALITAHAPDGRRMFAINLADTAVRSTPGDWVATGMAEANTVDVELAEADAVEVGRPEAYLDRPGFWHGAIGVACCWYGGAAGLAERLRAAAAGGKLDDHGLAHLGAVDSALHAARCALRAAAQDIDAGLLDDVSGAHACALRVRSTVEFAASDALNRVGRALGPGPLAQDAEHTKRAADLTVYIRQSHAERDLAELGGLVAETDPGAL
jgi:hypothetical protein